MDIKVMPNLLRGEVTPPSSTSKYHREIICAVLAHGEPLRQRSARQAREKLADELANESQLWAAWQQLFTSVTSQVAT